MRSYHKLNFTLKIVFIELLSTLFGDLDGREGKRACIW